MCKKITLIDFYSLNQTGREMVSYLTNANVEKVINVSVTFDHRKPFEEQAKDIVAKCGLSDQEWKERNIVINPPSSNFMALAVVMEIFKRSGKIVPCVRLRPETNPDGSMRITIHYDVAEIMFEDYNE